MSKAELDKSDESKGSEQHGRRSRGSASMAPPPSMEMIRTDGSNSMGAGSVNQQKMDPPGAKLSMEAPSKKHVPQLNIKNLPNEEESKSEGLANQ